MNPHQRYHQARKSGVDPLSPKLPLPKPRAYKLIETREGKTLGQGAWALIAHIKKNHLAVNPTAKYKIEAVY